MSSDDALPTIDHAGELADASGIPGYVLPAADTSPDQGTPYSCSFCGVGDSGFLAAPQATIQSEQAAPNAGSGVLHVTTGGSQQELKALVHADGRIEVFTATELAPHAAILNGEIEVDGRRLTVTAREIGRNTAEGALRSQFFMPYAGVVTLNERALNATVPTLGCVKLKLSQMAQRPAYPIHVAPSVLDRGTGTRRTITYEAAITRFADLLLAHRGDVGRALLYACGQIDYFAIFAIQEVFRLLGVRNLTGNAEHCLNAGAVHNEILTGQEGPFLTIDDSVNGPNRVFLFNGWNGFVTHPPVYRAIAKREDFDAFLVEVAVTETAVELAKRLGPERVLLIRPRADPHLALAIAHELLIAHRRAVEDRFIERFADPDSYERFYDLALAPRFEARHVAERIAPEPDYAVRIERGIRLIAHKFAQRGNVPINIPSVGLSQTSGVVAHCLWGSVLALLGKYGLKADGTPAGGTLRVPGQINAQTEVQGLSRKYFMGRIPIDEAGEAARRMGLPDDAYQAVAADPPRAALDYAESTDDKPELFVFFGTQFEANMMDRRRWIAKLEESGSRMVVVDPIPDPYTLAHADLIIPSPPHPATTKLYQNGEWKLSLSVPAKKAPEETRSDATILYDVMAEIARKLGLSADLRLAHPDLARHIESGYLQARFQDRNEGGGLGRIGGEVDRVELWRRIQAYMAGGSGPLYCRPEHADGRPIAWRELVEQGSIVYGGVGRNRYMLDYATPDHQPFADIYRQPRPFKFFRPTEADMHIPHGIIMNSGRSSLTSDRKRIQFAMSTFNSGKATPIIGMPDENPCHISSALAHKLGLKQGDKVRVTGRKTGAAIELPVIVTDRVKGESIYVSFHKSRGQMEEGRYINDVTSSEERCAYCSQTAVKANLVVLERVPLHVTAPAVAPGRRGAGIRLDTTIIDPKMDLPIWNGQDTPLYVNEIIAETHDVYTFRFQGDPLCRFVYWPGQYCSLVLNIDGKKVVRSYTISSTPTRPYVLEITVKRVPGGLVSNWLADNLHIGDRIEAAGPKGKFSLIPGKIPQKLLFLGAGSGVTPVMSMARWLCDVAADVDVQLFNSVRSPDDIIFRKELEYMTARYKMFSTVLLAETRGRTGDWSGLTGRINRPMLEMISSDLHDRHIYMCGPEGFMNAVRGILAELDFDLANFHTESFGGLRTSVDEKAAPIASGGAPVGEDVHAATGTLAIEFVGAGKTATTDGKTTLLEVAEDNDVDIGYGCRVGHCGDCKVKLVSGNVGMRTEHGLTPEDKAAGYILACVAMPRSNCALDV
ncbi:MAG: 2Fe-2S iron-sulfur cluster binding domain-containing protein [Alphaproteobacteria bacterium]|nr:2Fe-2S iron-sulfur cluster binding domain-containing protein [Alphaproteobacteria bacterium]